MNHDLMFKNGILSLKNNQDNLVLRLSGLPSWKAWFQESFKDYTLESDWIAIAEKEILILDKIWKESPLCKIIDNNGLINQDFALIMEILKDFQDWAVENRLSPSWLNVFNIEMDGDQSYQEQVVTVKPDALIPMTSLLYALKYQGYYLDQKNPLNIQYIDLKEDLLKIENEMESCNDESFAKKKIKEQKLKIKDWEKKHATFMDQQEKNHKVWNTFMQSKGFDLKLREFPNLSGLKRKQPGKKLSQ